MYIKGLFAFILTATGIIGAGKVATEVVDTVAPKIAVESIVRQIDPPAAPVRQEQPPASTTTTTTLPDVSNVDFTGLMALQAQAEPLDPRVEYGKCGEWRELALLVGWPVEQWPTLSHVLYRESRCSIGSHNKTDPMSGSRGLMQINGFWCRPSRYSPAGWLQEQGILSSCDDLYDPVINLRAGLAIWLYGEDRHGCGWRGPWATSCGRYTSIQPHPGL
jgi:hypothetical protein